MDDLLDEVVSPEDLKKFEETYNEQLRKGEVSNEAQFEYSWCLVRSKYPSDIRKGILLLEDLFSKHASGRRDYLYYLALGYAKIKEYSKALEFCRSFLQIEPMNQQVQQLEVLVKKKMDREGKIGMALTGAGILIVGSMVGLGIALAKNAKK